MSAVDQLKNSSNENFIARKYIDQVLQEGATHISAMQDKVSQSSSRDINDILTTRQYSVSNGTLSLSNSIQERFVDMKPRFKNYKRVKIHNAQIWTEFNLIAGKIAYGFLDSIKKTIAKEYKIDING